MRPLRLILLSAVAIGLTPGTWMRTPRPIDDPLAPLLIERLAIAPRPIGALRLEGVWRLSSTNPSFGGYSALVSYDGDRTMLAGSDSGQLLLMGWPDRPGKAAVRFGQFAAGTPYDKRAADLEALTNDPRDGTIWAGYERSNSIVRYDARFQRTGAVRPPSMRGWRTNSGPETLARLRDGRFMVISEGPFEWFGRHFAARLFPADPIGKGAPLTFRFAAPGSYRPVDAAQMPDGRVLVLLRRLHLGLPPAFSSTLVLADAADIAAGGVWSGKVIARIDAPDIRENYEGIAAIATQGEATTIWLIADDNFARYQDTLLLKLTLAADLR